MKRLLVSYFALLFGMTLFSLNSFSQKENSMAIGYSSNDLSTSLALGENNFLIYVNGAIKFNSDFVKDILGSRITNIVFAIEDTLSIQDNGIFISTDLNSDPVYEEVVPYLYKGWNNIKLEKPFEINAIEDIYIGFNYASKGMVVSFDGEQPNNNSNFFAFSQIKPENPSWYNETFGGCLNLYAIIEGDNLPQDRVEISMANISKTIPANTATPIDVYVKNVGANTIHDIEVICTLNDQESSFLIDGLEIQSNEFKLVTIKDFITDNIGVNTLNIKISKVNGNENTAVNNSFDFGNIICREYYKNRKNLLENFSTQLCVSCPRAEKSIKRILKKHSNIIPIVHHCGFSEDIFTIEESKEYLSFYNGSTYTPAVMINRTNFSRLGVGETNSPVFELQDENLLKAITEEVASSSDVSLNISCSYNEESRIMNIYAYGDSERVDNFSNDNICVTIFLTEDGLNGTQQSTSGIIQDYVYDNTLRAVLTDVWGDNVSFGADGCFKTETYQYKLDDGWDVNNMSVVAFIGNSVPSQPNNCVIYNAESEKIINENSSIDNAYNIDGNVIKVVNGKIYLDCTIKHAYLYSLSGSLIYSVEDNCEIDINNLCDGIYLLYVVSDKGKSVFKINK